MIWPHVTKKNPCGACGKTDWCQVGDKGWRCYRVESDHPFKNGGWFHPFDSTKPAPPKQKPLPVPPSINATVMIRKWADMGIPVTELAESLGVSVDSLTDLSAVYSPDHRAWAFPMRDGYGNMIGIRLRSDDGRKWAVRGSRSGIFLPTTQPHSTVYLPEGPTSTAATLTLGLYAIGRPSCNSGGPEIKTACKRLGVRRAVIVADNDDKPSGLRPGFDGALKLASEIGIPVVIWTPPTKDIRDFVRSGGTAQLILSDIKNFVWKIYR